MTIFFSALIKTASVVSHNCVSTDVETINGSLVISNADLTLLTAHKDSFESCFANQLQASSPSNNKATWKVQGIEHLGNDECQVSYTCAGVGDQSTALTCLKATPNADEFKTILGKCSHSSDAKAGAGKNAGVNGGSDADHQAAGDNKRIIIGGLIPVVTSHTCSSTDSDTINGCFNISHADLASLKEQQASFESCFTKQLQSSSPSNNKATWKVQGIEHLANDDCQVSYTCTGAGDQPSALTCLKATPDADEFKTILGKCSHSSGAKAGAGDNKRIIIGGLKPAVTSHTCSSTDSDTINGCFNISHADLASLNEQKESLESCFTKQLQSSSPSNNKATWKVQGIQHLDNHTCQVSYTCTGAGDQPSALTCLKATPDADEFKTILGKCSHSSGAKAGAGKNAGVSGGSDGNNKRIIIGGLKPAVTSHTCSSSDSDTINGCFNISNVDLTLLTAQKDSFESCFTKQLQTSSPSNNKATWKVQGIEHLANDECQVSYTCTGAGDQPTALTCLKATPDADDFKTILGKCSHSKGGE
ncbi:unnamed protein product [Adineta steineri]|uniref:Uncharacterized protein n=1 Tax=Adineta steineri TaxID=433720 RepID=A0A814D3C3_9BILA|nr:unnamed protein product [Adineta steineri]CAF0948771.1 unnamed protein product [Adineta steineri]CAF1094299.1 unnamed protein product [Adineta steineri]